MLWKGMITDELISLCRQYNEIFRKPPYGYVNVCYQSFTYEEFVAMIKESIRQRKELPSIIRSLRQVELMK